MAINTRLVFFVTLLGLVATSQPLSAAVDARSPRRLAALHKPVLKPLVPQEDLSLEPDPTEVFDHAVKEYSAGHMAQAEKLFQEVLRLDPNNADAHFNLGAIREWANDFNAALSHYQAALRIKPGDPELQDAVSSVTYKIKNRVALQEQARRNKQAQDLAAHSQAARQAFAQQDYVGAITHLNYLVKAMPNDAKIQFALGQSLRAMKYYQWAAYRLKLAIYLDPNNALYRTTLVELDKEEQDAQGAAYKESAQMALNKIQPFSFTELAGTGMRRHEF
ncbi:MAG TPA: tetratricopeptide repeat protein [Candidatus Obscuribacterales bacterium]